MAYSLEPKSAGELVEMLVEWSAEALAEPLSVPLTAHRSEQM